MNLQRRLEKLEQSMPDEDELDTKICDRIFLRTISDEELRILGEILGKKRRNEAEKAALQDFRDRYDKWWESLAGSDRHRVLRLVNGAGSDKDREWLEKTIPVNTQHVHIEVPKYMPKPVMNTEYPPEQRYAPPGVTPTTTPTRSCDPEGDPYDETLEMADAKLDV